MGLCGLCRKYSELKDSHLMPKSLYGALRNAYPESGHDLVFARKSTKTAGFTDYQVKKPFLCACCEDRFSKFGENIVAPECHRGKGNFTLLDKIKVAKAEFIQNEERWISPQNCGTIESSAYLYFAVSIIWRASAGDWADGLELYHGALGEKYQERIRRYLLGETDCPKNIYLAVYVDNDNDLLPLMSFPVVNNKSGYHHHIFYIPGVKFSLVIGSKADGVKELFEQSQTNIYFIEYSFRKHPDFKLFQRETKYGLTPKGRLAKGLSRE
ncbi:hypothetical protein [Geomonas anaerohicana]|uniref:HNH endonuclease n=1 Tax=Geomonas anaerohicana TaxID=2798583 RepID=A0ABS0YB78_9BACT|nr:hypothetical protein [Geomonas anaerohicana]MBJ6749558.1 hypothetical protein [Geomonas anaerohicana]